jgi:hypothetical protein
MLFVYVFKELDKFSANFAYDFIKDHIFEKELFLREYLKLLEYVKLSHKEICQAVHSWLMPVILAT